MRNSYKIFREITVSLLGGKCEICGITTNLNVHHKDRNSLNNKRENLSLLCKSHHDTHHSKELNDFFQGNKNLGESHELICPICKKKIISLSEQQADYNYKQHIESHNRGVKK